MRIYIHFGVCFAAGSISHIGRRDKYIASNTSAFVRPSSRVLERPEMKLCSLLDKIFQGCIGRNCVRERIGYYDLINQLEE